jgi:beta-1,4-mannosyltransferase
MASDYLHALVHRPAFVALILLVILALTCLAAILFLFLWIAIARAPATTSKTSLGRSAAVVVLGDIGRSPRICFHAQSLAEDGWRVAMVGYQGTPPPPALRRSSVKLHYIVQPFAWLVDRLPRGGIAFMALAAPLKVVGQTASLFWTLSTQVRPPPELIIAQTPPALPTLAVVRLVALLLGSRVVIDWHNLGFSILAMRFKPTSPVVRLASVLERISGRSAFTHLCVTESLQKFLQRTWKVSGPVKVLYDRPPSHYRRATTSESHRLLSGLLPSLQPSIQDWCDAPSFALGNGSLQDRPALVVSSTSWTADEDFSMLLRAASMYEMRARELNDRSDVCTQPSPNLLESPLVGQYQTPVASPASGTTRSNRDRTRRASIAETLPKASRLPKMLLIVTGKGELRDQYLREIEVLEQQERWQWVRIRTAWLSTEEYPVLLGSADVGVSLHSSSSGMDLPMKVVDMLGCGLPVCALGFPCIGELVKSGENGLVFYSDKELAEQLESLLADHPDPSWLAARTSTASSLFPEDIARTPTGSTRASPHLGFATDMSRTPTGSSIVRPSSPLPLFTLLQSPTNESFADGDVLPSGSATAKQRNWSANWKRVVRPIILAADLEEDSRPQRALTDVKRTPPSRSHSGGSTTTQRQHVSPTNVRQRRLFDDSAEDDQAIGTLRHRSGIGRLQASAAISSSQKDSASIPGIEISAPL